MITGVVAKDDNGERVSKTFQRAHGSTGITAG
jgi:hypothetical protein